MENMIVTGGLAQRATHAAFTLRTVRPRATVLLSGAARSVWVVCLLPKLINSLMLAFVLLLVDATAAAAVAARSTK